MINVIKAMTRAQDYGGSWKSTRESFKAISAVHMRMTIWACLVTIRREMPLLFLAAFEICNAKSGTLNAS
jgi:hypothetical protein